MSTDLVRIRKQAEKAVEDMKDGPLREKAFETILNHLLVDKSAGVIEDAPARRTQKITVDSTKARSSGIRGKAGPMARVESLVDEGFFTKPRTISDVRAALRERGHSYPNTTLSPVLVRLTRKKALRRTVEKQAGKKASFIYSNW